MSLIIKGLNMPKNGEMTIAFASDENNENTLALILDANGKPIEHKGVAEIHTPHGRLIDADELIKILERHRDMCGDVETQYGIDMEIRIINNTPTIIEAEVSE